MQHKNIIEEIHASTDLLALPQALSELLREMEKCDFSVDQLANIILKDASLTGRLLRMANSSFYCRGSEVTTVHAAVQAIGMITVKCLALSSSVLHPEKIQRESGVDAKEYFARILSIAAAAEKIASQIDAQLAEEAFVAGLLQDIGTMYFLHHHPLDYRKVMTRVSEGEELLFAEASIFGATHCEVGYQIAKKWNLPDYIRTAISGHHALADENDSRIDNIVRLAVLVASRSDLTNGDDIATWIAKLDSFSTCLTLDRADIDNIVSSLLAWTTSAAEFLGVSIGSAEDILTRANKELWEAFLMIERMFKERQELSQKLLVEERARGAIESKNIALSTLSHYLNNAAMAIYGRSQLMRISLDRGEQQKVVDHIPEALDVIDNSIKKIVAVLSEMKDISPMDEVEYLNASQAMNLDDRIAARVGTMDGPDDAPNKRKATAAPRG